MTTYQNVIDRASIILKDESGDEELRRWTIAELLGWAKDAEHTISILKPDSYPVIESTLLAAGAKQSIPSYAHQLLDVLCNLGTNGSTRGNIVEVVDKRWMNAIDPGWMSTTASNTVTHVIYDVKRSPRIYWVYPQSTGSNYLELMFAELPNNSSKVITNSILLPDEYIQPMLHFILMMAFLKDSDIPASAQRFQSHFGIFGQLLNRKDISESEVNPKKTRSVE